MTTRSEGYTPPPFSRYAPILERMPFGELPEKFGQNSSVDPNAATQELLLKAEQQKLASSINMSAVNITPQGATAIGFTDLSAKPPVSYYLLVGTEAGGWRVNSADYDAETAEIEKDGVSIAIQLGKGMVETPAAPSAPPKNPAATPALAAKKNPLTPAGQGAALARPSAAGGGPSASATSIRDKLRAAQASQTAQQEAGGDSDTRSYMERLRERKIEQAKALEIAQSTQRQQLEKLAREVASKEIEKQAAIAEETALEKELVLEEERLQKEEEERLEKQAEKETPAP